MTITEYQKAYYDGMTASEWVNYALRLNGKVPPPVGMVFDPHPLIIITSPLNRNPTDPR